MRPSLRSQKPLQRHSIKRIHSCFPHVPGCGVSGGFTSNCFHRFLQDHLSGEKNLRPYLSRKFLNKKTFNVAKLKQWTRNVLVLFIKVKRFYEICGSPTVTIRLTPDLTPSFLGSSAISLVVRIQRIISRSHSLPLHVKSLQYIYPRLRLRTIRSRHLDRRQWDR